jgi:hypothetical protein
MLFLIRQADWCCVSFDVLLIKYCFPRAVSTKGQWRSLRILSTSSCRKSSVFNFLPYLDYVTAIFRLFANLLSVVYSLASYYRFIPYSDSLFSHFIKLFQLYYMRLIMYISVYIIQVIFYFHESNFISFFSLSLILSYTYVLNHYLIIIVIIICRFICYMLFYFICRFICYFNVCISASHQIFISI